jgi:hypothetical protein
MKRILASSPAALAASLPPPVLAACFGLALLFSHFLTGCTTSQQAAAFKVETGANISVSAAMTGWGAYVALQHPGTNAEQTVYNAFESYKSANLAAINATEALAQSPTTISTNVVISAQNLASQSITNLVNLIQSFGVTLK